MAREYWHSWHRCEPWNKAKLPCPYAVLKDRQEEEEPEDTWVQEQAAVIGESRMQGYTGEYRMHRPGVPVGVTAAVAGKAGIMQALNALALNLLASGIVDARGQPMPAEIYQTWMGQPAFPHTAELGLAELALQSTWASAQNAAMMPNIFNSRFQAPGPPAGVVRPVGQIKQTVGAHPRLGDASAIRDAEAKNAERVRLRLRAQTVAGRYYRGAQSPYSGRWNTSTQGVGYRSSWWGSN